jgi:hypothetical protein
MGSGEDTYARPTSAAEAAILEDTNGHDWKSCAPDWTLPPSRQALEICDRAGMRNLDSAHAHVLESHGAEADGVEDVFGVDYQWATQEVPDFRKVQCAEFGPACADDQGFNSFGGGVG